MSGGAFHSPKKIAQNSNGKVYVGSFRPEYAGNPPRSNVGLVSEECRKSPRLSSSYPQTIIRLLSGKGPSHIVYYRNCPTPPILICRPLFLIGSMKLISGVMVEGWAWRRSNIPEKVEWDTRVTHYSVEFSPDGRLWTALKDENGLPRVRKKKSLISRILLV